MPSADDKRALARAYRLLAVRARSEAEVRQSLSRSGFEAASIETTVSRLRESGLLDDRIFADQWTRSRMQSRPRSKRLIEHELQARGVSSDDASAATSGIDDEATAMKLALRRVQLLRGLDRQKIIRRLSQYLVSRGFSSGTVSRAVALALAELEGSKH